MWGASPKAAPLDNYKCCPTYIPCLLLAAHAWVEPEYAGLDGVGADLADRDDGAAGELRDGGGLAKELCQLRHRLEQVVLEEVVRVLLRVGAAEEVDELLRVRHQPARQLHC